MGLHVGENNQFSLLIDIARHSIVEAAFTMLIHLYCTINSYTHEQENRMCSWFSNG